MMTDQAKSRGIVRFREAAEVLQRLGLCKAFGPRGQVNGPNCQRFGHRESISRRWYWDVNEILEKAVRKGSVSRSVIESVATQYGLLAPNESAAPHEDLRGLR